MTTENTPSTRSGEDLLTRKEVCEQYKISGPWLCALGLRGEGPEMVRLSPKKILYRRSAIEAWIQAHTVRAS